MRRHTIPALLFLILFPGFAIHSTAQLINGRNHYSPKANQLAGQLWNRFYPTTLINPKNPKYRSGCVAIYNTDKNGDPQTIFANYTAKRGEFLVIRRKANGKYWAAPVPPSAQFVSSKGYDFSQLGCTIYFLRLTKQGRRSVILGLMSNDSNESDWVFQWNGTRAVNISPTFRFSNKGAYEPVFSNTSFVYLYPNGLAAVSAYDHFMHYPGDYYETHPDYDQIYRLQKGRYVLAANAAYFSGPMAIPSAPAPATQRFVLRRKSTGPYVLRIANGNLYGKDRVTSAEIRINGKEVVPPGKINSKTNILTLPLRHVLKLHNTIKVTAQGSRSSQLSVVVEDHTPHLIPAIP